MFEFFLGLASGCMVGFAVHRRYAYQDIAAQWVAIREQWRMIDQEVE